MTKAIQYMDQANDKPAAEMMLGFLATQVDYLGGRVLPPKGPRSPWRVQAFFSPCDPETHWLPDGCQQVLVPDHMLTRKEG